MRAINIPGFGASIYMGTEKEATSLERLFEARADRLERLFEARADFVVQYCQEKGWPFPLRALY